MGGEEGGGRKGGDAAKNPSQNPDSPNGRKPAVRTSIYPLFVHPACFLSSLPCAFARSRCSRRARSWRCAAGVLSVSYSQSCGKQCTFRLGGAPGVHQPRAVPTGPRVGRRWALFQPGHSARPAWRFASFTSGCCALVSTIYLTTRRAGHCQPARQAPAHSHGPALGLHWGCTHQFRLARE